MGNNSIMNDNDKLKLVDTLFMIHENFDIDGITTFEIGHETRVDDLHIKDEFNVIYKLSEYGIPVPVGHPIKTFDELKAFKPPVPGLADVWMKKKENARLLFPAVSLNFNIIIQHLLGSSLAPIVIGRLSDTYGLDKALTILPVFAFIAGILLFMGSFYYKKDIYH